MLDMSRAGRLTDYLFERMSGILSGANIDYVKWDFEPQPHRSRAAALLPRSGRRRSCTGTCWGLYELLERLTDALPRCAVRGLLRRRRPVRRRACSTTAPQIWTQRRHRRRRAADASSTARLCCYPASAMGAHVSACPTTRPAGCTSFDDPGHRGHVPGLSATSWT